MAKKQKNKVPAKTSSPSQGKPVKVSVQTETETDPKSETRETTPVTPVANVVKSERSKSGKQLPNWAWFAIFGGVILIGGAVWAGFVLMGEPDPAAPNIVRNQNHNTNANNLTARMLDGVYVDPSKANPNIYAVMIENLTSSRPPSGLDGASVVYEALAEGGITRFMALFPVGGGEISEIGPIRSARRYYIAWAEEYNKLLYIHVGGSPDALSYLRSSQSNVVDFNQFSHGPNFWRDRTRSAPHNLYSSTEKLYLGLKSVAPDLVPDYVAWPFKDDAAPKDRSNAHPEIKIEYSSFNYNVTYKYHPELNLYFRLQGEAEHVVRTGEKIRAKTVVVQFVQTGLLAGDRQRLEMRTEGEGRALVFRDGQVIEGTWKKPSGRERTQFFDQQNQPIEFNRGPIWISVLPTDRTVTY